MSNHIHTNFYQDGLRKDKCNNCEREFIVGTDLARDCYADMICPYCGSQHTQAVAEMREDLLDELGCMGIYYYK